jgi:hypothetical protein
MVCHPARTAIDARRNFAAVGHSRSWAAEDVKDGLRLRAGDPVLRPAPPGSAEHPGVHILQMNAIAF